MKTLNAEKKKKNYSFSGNSHLKLTKEICLQTKTKYFIPAERH